MVSETQSKRSYASIENEPEFSSNNISNQSPIKQIIKNIVDVITNEIIENEFDWNCLLIIKKRDNNNSIFTKYLIIAVLLLFASDIWS